MTLTYLIDSITVMLVRYFVLTITIETTPLPTSNPYADFLYNN